MAGDTILAMENKLDYINIGKRIRAERISLKSLADASGVSERTVSNWLSGATEPNASQLKALCDFIGIEIKDAYKQEEGL